jgi:protoporphyrinogen/coproporphyrinogen III oxidase
VEHVDVAVIGAGIAGLAAAYRVTTSAPTARVIVLEANSRAGGLLGSARVAGRTVDTAADAFLARVDGAVDLAIELGLGDDLVAPATGQAAVVTHGLLRPLPEGLVLGVPTNLDALGSSEIISAEGIRRAGQDLLHARPYDGPDRSVADAVGSHLGPEVVDRLVDPLLGGISAAHSAQLSVDSVSPLIATASKQPHLTTALLAVQAAERQGQIGVTEGRPVFLAPRQGVHQLVDKLTAQLGEALRYSVHVRRVQRCSVGWSIETSGGTVTADQVIVTTPAFVTASILSDQPVATDLLATIRYASVALAVMAYRSSDVVVPPGSGMLVPRVEQRLVTAASWWDQKWPHLSDPDHVLIRASVGRIDDVRHRSLTDVALLAAIHDDLSAVGGVRLNAPPVDAVVARWDDSFAQYDVGHLERVGELHRSLPRGLHLAGASLRGVGLPACIRSANQAALMCIDALNR